MSASKFTLSNVTLTLAIGSLTVEESATHSPLSLLGALISRIPEGEFTVHTSSGAEPEPTAEAAAPTAEPQPDTPVPSAPAAHSFNVATQQAVVHFIELDPDYELRSFDVIAKNLDVSGSDKAAFSAFLGKLVDDGVLYRRTRRSDGAALFGVATA